MLLFFERHVLPPFPFPHEGRHDFEIILGVRVGIGIPVLLCCCWLNGVATIVTRHGLGIRVGVHFIILWVLGGRSWKRDPSTTSTTRLFHRLVLRGLIVKGTVSENIVQPTTRDTEESRTRPSFHNHSVLMFRGDGEDPTLCRLNGGNMIIQGCSIILAKLKPKHIICLRLSVSQP